MRSGPMRDLLPLLVHFLTTLARLLGPGGTRAVIAETLVIKHQLVILNRSRRRASNLTAADRIVMRLCTLFINPSRIRKVAAALKPATLLAFHRALKERKYRRLFSPVRGEFVLTRRQGVRKGPRNAFPNAPGTIFYVADERQPRRASSAGPWPVVLRKNPPHHVLFYLDTKRL